MDVRAMASKGQRAMRASQSSAEKVFWPLQAGRPRQGQPGLLEAVHIGRTAANRLYSAVTEAGLNLKDSGCVLICGSKAHGTQAMGRFDHKNADSSDLEMAKMILSSKAKPIGIALLLIDREKSQVLTHARPFERTERTEHLLSAVLDEWSLDFKKGVALKFD